MLFNPFWDKTEQKADPMVLGTLISWLEKQRPGGRYDYKSCTDCLLARYFSDQGYSRITISRNLLMHGKPAHGDLEIKVLPEHFNWIAEGEPRTFEGALKRAELSQSRPRLADLAENKAFEWSPW